MLEGRKEKRREALYFIEAMLMKYFDDIILMRDTTE
jgi:hypothetical protein